MDKQRTDASEVQKDTDDIRRRVKETETLLRHSTMLADTVERLSNWIGLQIGRRGR